MKKLLILLILLIAVPCWGANVYIDPTWGGTESGTFAEPYDSWADVTITAGNDYRQKCGTTETVTAMSITADGTSENHIIIGAYYDDSGVVHEDTSPNFGQLCGNSDQKPILKQTNVGALPPADNIFQSTDMNYVEFNSLQLKDASEAIEIHGNNNIVRYCYIYHTRYGVRIGLEDTADFNIVEYNFIDLADDVNEDGTGNDAIALQFYADTNTIQYNHITGFDHGGIQINGGDNNIIQYNYLYESSSDNSEDFCLGHNYSASGNIERYNFCDGAGQAVEILGGQSNEIYGNLLVCDDEADAPYEYQACIDLITSDALVAGGWDSDDNLIYNNTVYYRGAISGVYGLKMVTGSYGSCETTTIQGNYVVNNVFINSTGEVFRLIDNCGSSTLSNNYFYNNIGYGFEAGSYGVYLGTNKADADAWNSASDNHTGNLDTDPSLSNPATGAFWPDSSSDPVVGTGYTLGSPYNQLIVPGGTTDFTATPPVVNLETQSPNNIGAYKSSDAGPVAPTYPLQGVKLEGAKYN